MKFYMPVLVYQEENVIWNHREELRQYGKKALVVTGRHSSKVNGSQKDLEAALDDQGIKYVFFSEIEENPSMETAEKAAEYGKQEGVDFVIGMGGGSAMDASKAIALLIKNPEETKEVFYQNKPLLALPVIAIPTTAGTGSEVTPYAILTIHEKRTKKSISHRIFPKMALLDSKYLSYAGEKNTKNTYADILGHLVESFLHAKSDSYNRMCSSYGMKLWPKLCQPVASMEMTKEDYARLSETGMIAGMAITHTGTSLPHGMSYALTYEYQIPHGKAVGIFLPFFLAIYEDQEAVNEVLSYLDFGSVEEVSEYMKSLLGKVEVSHEDRERFFHSFAADTARHKAYPYSIGEKQLREMYEDALSVR